MSHRPDRWWLVVAAGVIYVMILLDALSVAIALPTIGADLDASPSAAQWVLVGFTLPAVSLGLPAGRYLDRVGQRTALVLSVTGFAAAAGAAALAPDLGWLIAARVVQGGFGALLFALMPLLASEAVRPQWRGRAIGWAFGIGPLGAIGGTVVVGVMVESLGWESIFYPHLLLAAVILALGLWQLDGKTRVVAPGRAMLVESVLLTIAVLAALLALSFAAEGHYVWLGLGLLALPPVLAWRRMDSGRLVLRLLRIPAVRAPMIALWTQTLAQLTIQFLIPFHLARYARLDAAAAGLVLLGLPVGMVVFSPIAGWLTDVWGARRTAMTGMIVCLTATATLLGLGADWTAFDLAWRLGLFGVGAGLFSGAQTAMAMAATPAALLGSVSAALSFARQLGIAAAPALATIMWSLSGYGIAGMRLALAVVTLAGLGGLYALWRARSTTVVAAEPRPVKV